MYKIYTKNKCKQWQKTVQVCKQMMNYNELVFKSSSNCKIKLRKEKKKLFNIFKKLNILSKNSKLVRSSPKNRLKKFVRNNMKKLKN